MPGRALQHTRVINEAVPHCQCKDLDQPMSGMYQVYIEGYSTAFNLGCHYLTCAPPHAGARARKLPTKRGAGGL